MLLATPLSPFQVLKEFGGDKQPILVSIPSFYQFHFFHILPSKTAWHGEKKIRVLLHSYNKHIRLFSIIFNGLFWGEGSWPPKTEEQKASICPYCRNKGSIPNNEIIWTELEMGVAFGSSGRVLPLYIFKRLVCVLPPSSSASFHLSIFLNLLMVKNYLNCIYKFTAQYLS